MTDCASPLLRSLLAVKQTSLVAAHMTAFALSRHGLMHCKCLLLGKADMVQGCAKSNRAVEANSDCGTERYRGSGAWSPDRV